MSYADLPKMNPVGGAEGHVPTPTRAGGWPATASWLVDAGVVAVCLLIAQAGSALAEGAGAPLVILPVALGLAALLSVSTVMYARATGRGSPGQRLVGLPHSAAAADESERAEGPPCARTVLAATVAVAVIGAWFADVALGFTWHRYYLPSGSMSPTLKLGDVVLVNRLHYVLGQPRHGDLVVYRFPAFDEELRGKLFVKRVVGLPGDTIEVQDGLLYRNGAERHEGPAETAALGPSVTCEPYRIPEAMKYTWEPHTVAPGQVFVFGDNRNDSNDSHRWMRHGPSGAYEDAPGLPITNLEGKAVFRYLPPNRIGVVR
jgi:signal peptidase I